MSFSESQTILCNDEVCNLVEKGALTEVLKPVLSVAFLPFQKNPAGLGQLLIERT